MIETPQNRYLGLSKKELKSLKRANKDNPEAIKLIEAAMDAFKPPYKAGRLVNADISAVADIATLIIKVGAGGQAITFDEATSKGLVEKAEQLLAAVRPFLIQTTDTPASAPAPESAAVRSAPPEGTPSVPEPEMATA